MTKHKTDEEKAAEQRAAKEEQARREREAAETKARETAGTTGNAATTIQGAAAATLQAGQEHANAVDEANRAAQEEARLKDEEMRRRDAEAAASVATMLPGAAGPDPKGRADGAASYDPPTLNPQPGTPEWHLAHPGEITSGSFAPREQSAEDFHEARKGETESDNVNKMRGPAGAANEARIKMNEQREAQARKARA